jgi:hypothetical protein
VLAGGQPTSGREPLRDRLAATASFRRVSAPRKGCSGELRLGRRIGADIVSFLDDRFRLIVVPRVAAAPKFLQFRELGALR